jgi:hypothetical protein
VFCQSQLFSKRRINVIAELSVSSRFWNSGNLTTLLTFRPVLARAREAFIYGRLRLADLILPVAEAFLKDKVTIGHALLIAKLQA